MKQYRFFTSSVLAGFAISLSAYCYATLNGALIAAILFSFGLLTIVLYEFPLYTGRAGFILKLNELPRLFAILIGNAIGCFFAATILTCTKSYEEPLFIWNAVNNRCVFDYGDVLPIICKALCCGFIMTTAVNFAKRQEIYGAFAAFLPLLIGVPLFLLCGFFHSIVDAFYLSYSVLNPNEEITANIFNGLLGWCVVVVGNFIGCNLSRILTFNKHL